MIQGFRYQLMLYPTASMITPKVKTTATDKSQPATIAVNVTAINLNVSREKPKINLRKQKKLI